jgi:outer membrane receptor for ferrienterochelin and colicins
MTPWCRRALAVRLLALALPLAPLVRPRAGEAAPLPSDVLTIDGRVVDGSDARVPGATLLLRRQSTGFERLSRSDGAGGFTFPGLSAGRYTLLVRAPRLASVEREVDVPCEPIVIALEPSPVVEQVTVVSGARQSELRESLGSRVDVVTSAQARDTGYESVGELLREVPGVLTRRGSETAGAAGEQVQGLDSRQVLVLLDGQPLVGARGVKRGVLNLDRQSVARLDRVEIVKGAASALYGSDAVGGVINLMTRDPQGPLDASIVATRGTHGVFDLRGDVGFVRDRVRGLVGLERHENDGFDLTPTTPDTTGAAFGRWDAFAKLRFDITPSVRLAALANGYWNNAQGRSVGELGLQRDDIDDASQNLGLTVDWQAGPRTAVQARAYHARYDETDDNRLLDEAGPALENGELRERLHKLDASASHVVGERHLLQGGAEWWRDAYRGVNRLRDHTGDDVTTAVAWVQDRLSLAPRVTLTLGARFDDNSAFGSAWSPKAALNVRAGAPVSLRASYGRGFRAPDLGQLYYRFLNPTSFYQVLGNLELRPERSRSYQLGGELSLARGRARLGLNLFRNDVDDLIDSVSLGFAATPAQLEALAAREGLDPSFRPVAGRLVFTYRNVSDARTQGLEADAEIALAAGLSLAGAYTLLEAFDSATGLALTNRSRHRGSARLGWKAGNGRTRANLRVIVNSSWIVSRTAAASGPVVETRAPGYSLLDAYAARRVVRGIEAYAAVDNLTDNRDPNTGQVNAQGAPQPLYRAEVGRTVRFGLRWESR